MIDYQRSPEQIWADLVEEGRKKLHDNGEIIWCTDCDREIPYGAHGNHMEYLEVRKK